MTGPIIEQEQRERLARLAAFAALLTKEGVGRWPDAKRSENTEPSSSHVVMMTSFPYTPEALSFQRYCYDDGWVLGNFDWPAWAKQPAGSRYLENPALIANVDTETLSRLLTVILRSERFCEGSIEGFWSRGVIPAILDRAAELAKA